MAYYTHPAIYFHVGINIGFEKGEYTFNESDGAIFDTVTLIKDRPTEQTFIVSVIAQMQKSYRDATAGKDFSVDHQINLHFGPEMNTLAVRFEIFDDAVPEGTEAFQFFSFMGITKDNPNFDCKLAEGCLPSTLIKINDDDGNCHLCTCMGICTLLTLVFLCSSDCWI